MKKKFIPSIHFNSVQIIFIVLPHIARHIKANHSLSLLQVQLGSLNQPQLHLSYAIAILELLQYSSTLGVPDSINAGFEIVSDTCHAAPYYLNSDKPFLTLSNQYCNPEQRFKPGSLGKCLLEFYTRSKLLGHHGQLCHSI